MDREAVVEIARELTRLKLEPPRMPRIERSQVAAVAASLARPESDRAVLLDGPRRSGKSTILYQVLDRSSDSESPLGRPVYVDLEDARLGRVTVREIVAALTATLGEDDRMVVLLDEVHNAEEWWRDVKFLVDHEPRVRLVIADSCAAIVQAKVRESGVGRWESLPVHPLSLHEWWALRAERGIPLPTGLERAESVLEYLEIGGFPEYASQGEIARCHELLRKDVVSQVARRDLASVHGLREGQSIELLLVALLAASGAKLSQQEMAASINASERSVRDWRRAFLDTGLVWEVTPWARSAGKHARKQPKIYAVDSGLVAACSRPVFGGSRDVGHTGRLVETAVAQAMRIHAERNDGRLSFYAANGGRTGEADFVLEAGGFTGLVEVTAGDGSGKGSALSRRASEVDADWVGVVALRATPGTIAAGAREIRFVLAHDFLDALGRDRAEELGWPA